MRLEVSRRRVLIEELSFSLDCDGRVCEVAEDRLFGKELVKLLEVGGGCF